MSTKTFTFYFKISFKNYPKEIILRSLQSLAYKDALYNIIYYTKVLATNAQEERMSHGMSIRV